MPSQTSVARPENIQDVRGNLPAGAHVPESRSGVRDVRGMGAERLRFAPSVPGPTVRQIDGGYRENSARVCTSLVLRRYGDHSLGQSDPHPEAA